MRQRRRPWLFVGQRKGHWIGEIRQLKSLTNKGTTVVQECRKLADRICRIELCCANNSSLLLLLLLRRNPSTSKFQASNFAQFYSASISLSSNLIPASTATVLAGHNLRESCQVIIRRRRKAAGAGLCRVVASSRPPLGNKKEQMLDRCVG